MAGTFISYSSVSQHTFAFGYPTMTIAKPAGTQDGDTLIAFWTNSFFAGSSAFAPDSTWFQDDDSGYSNGVSMTVNRGSHIASSDPSSYTWTATGPGLITTYFGVVLCYRGLDPADFVGGARSGDTAPGGTGASDETKAVRGFWGYNATSDPTIDAALTERFHMWDSLQNAYILIGDEDLVSTTVPARTATIVGSTSVHGADTTTYGITAVPVQMPNDSSAGLYLPETKLHLKGFPNRLNDGTLDGVK